MEVPAPLPMGPAFHPDALLRLRGDADHWRHDMHKPILTILAALCILACQAFSMQAGEWEIGHHKKSGLTISYRGRDVLTGIALNGFTPDYKKGLFSLDGAEEQTTSSDSLASLVLLKENFIFCIVFLVSINLSCNYPCFMILLDM